MKTKDILISIALFININGFSQMDWECGYVDTGVNTQSTDCANSSQTFLEKFRTPGHWVPDANASYKTIKVNWIICLDDNGQNGWSNNSYIRNEIAYMIDSVNNFFIESLPPNYNIECPPSGVVFEKFDTRIRFELNEIIL